MFTDYYLPTLGGVQTSIKAQKEALEALGHRVTVLCPLHGSSDDPSIVRLPTHRFIKPDGYPFAWSPQRVKKAAMAALQRLKPDVVHVHSEMFVAFAGLVVARKLGIPLVQTMHGRLDVYTRNVLPVPAVTCEIYERLHHHFISHDDTHIEASDYYTRHRPARNMWRNMVAQANYADQVIVPSAHFAQKLQKQGVRKPVTVLSNGLEESVMIRLDDAEIRTRAENEPLRIMWCGRVSPEKRPLVFLDAISKLRGNFTVDMYGDGVAMKQVKKFCAREGLDYKVTVHGGIPQNEVFAAMRTSHVFVSSSFDFDNQPMVMLEAVATGLPVVYCDPDLGEVVPEEGSLCTPNPEAEVLASTLQKLIDRPQAVENLSRGTLKERQRAEQSNFTDALLAVYIAALES